MDGRKVFLTAVLFAVTGVLAQTPNQFKYQAVLRNADGTIITNEDANKLTNMNVEQANEFLLALFSSQEKRGFISLNNGNVVLYNILEQKLLDRTNTNPNNPIVRLKSAMFNEGLVKNLQNKYKTEIFIEGL